MAPQELDISKFEPAQLAEIRQQLQQEIESLGDSFQKLRQAQAKFKSCAQTVDTLSKDKAATENKPLLVPLTSSLYVKGTLSDADRYMVDFGTGYYVERDSKNTITYFNQKVANLDKNIIQLEKVVNDKVSNLRAVEQVLQMKLSQQQQK